MKLLCYSPAKQDEWDQFVKQSKNGLFMFERGYMDYHADRFHDHSLMIYDDADKLLAVLPANKADDVLHSHQGLTFGGFITGQSMKAATMLEIFSLLKAHMSENNLAKLVYKAIPYIYHNLPAQEDLYALFRNQAKLFRVDITTTVELDTKLPFAELRKRGIKKALKNDIVIEQSHDFHGFMTLLETVLQAKHGLKPVHSVAEIELLVSRFPQQIKLYVAKQNGNILAGTLIFEYRNIAHAQYIASSQDGQNLGALDAVFGHLLDTVYKNKTYFNFGVSSENAGQHLNEGLINQKEGFGGRAVIHEFFEATI